MRPDDSTTPTRKSIRVSTLFVDFGTKFLSKNNFYSIFILTIYQSIWAYLSVRFETYRFSSNVQVFYLIFSQAQLATQFNPTANSKIFVSSKFTLQTAHLILWESGSWSFSHDIDEFVFGNWSTSTLITVLCLIWCYREVNWSPLSSTVNTYITLHKFKILDQSPAFFDDSIHTFKGLLKGTTNFLDLVWNTGFYRGQI